MKSAVLERTGGRTVLDQIDQAFVLVWRQLTRPDLMTAMDSPRANMLNLTDADVDGVRRRCAHRKPAEERQKPSFTPAPLSMTNLPPRALLHTMLCCRRRRFR
jgi:hypothetical protein